MMASEMLSWREVEDKCRSLDAANIRVTGIDIVPISLNQEQLLLHTEEADEDRSGWSIAEEQDAGEEQDVAAASPSADAYNVVDKCHLPDGKFAVKGSSSLDRLFPGASKEATPRPVHCSEAPVHSPKTFPVPDVGHLQGLAWNKEESGLGIGGPGEPWASPCCQLVLSSPVSTHIQLSLPDIDCMKVVKIGLGQQDLCISGQPSTPGNDWTPSVSSSSKSISLQPGTCTPSPARSSLSSSQGSGASRGTADASVFSRSSMDSPPESRGSTSELSGRNNTHPQRRECQTRDGSKARRHVQCLATSVLSRAEPTQGERGRHHSNVISASCSILSSKQVKLCEDDLEGFPGIRDSSPRAESLEGVLAEKPRSGVKTHQQRNPFMRLLKRASARCGVLFTIHQQAKGGHNVAGD